MMIKDHGKIGRYLEWSFSQLIMRGNWNEGSGVKGLTLRGDCLQRQWFAIELQTASS